MKTQLRSTLITCLFALATSTTVTVAVRAADLAAGDQQFLTAYEPVRATLAADDLAGAKRAAAALGEPGAELAKSDSLTAARAAFGKLSDRAVKLAAGQPGFYVVHCPMVKGGTGDWVQTSEKVANPYMGKAMLGCGVVKK